MIVVPSPAVSGPRARRAHRIAVATAAVSAVLSAGLLGACGADEARTASSPGDTVAVGGVPPILTLPTPGTLASGASVPAPDGTVGERALGNRLILIGDSILAGTSTRYGGEACSTFVPLGWQVAVEAEVGRAVDFGNEVLDDRPPEEWDAAVVFLGTNYSGDEEGYAEQLGRILDRLEPRPIVLVTVSNYRPEQMEVNEVIEREIVTRDTVDVFDWTTISASPGVLSGDDVHPTDAGRRLLVDGLADLIGRPPRIPGSPPACLESEQVDDSAGATASIPWSSTTRPTVRPPVAPVVPSTAGPVTTATAAPTAPTTALPPTSATTPASSPTSAP